jgi:hypothetical protein
LEEVKKYRPNWNSKGCLSKNKKDDVRNIMNKVKFIGNDFGYTGKVVLVENQKVKHVEENNIKKMIQTNLKAT